MHNPHLSTKFSNCLFTYLKVLYVLVDVRDSSHNLKSISLIFFLFKIFSCKQKKNFFSYIFFCDAVEAKKREAEKKEISIVYLCNGVRQWRASFKSTTSSKKANIKKNLSWCHSCGILFAFFYKRADGAFLVVGWISYCCFFFSCSLSRRNEFFIYLF